MATAKRAASVLVLTGFCAAALAAQEHVKRTWNFDEDRPGAIAHGFLNESGHWVVAASDMGRALAQTAKHPDETFNVTLVKGTHVRDLDLSVRMKPVAGILDQGGGLVWRAKDAKNYYIARYNPLENNFRVYKVVDGKRTLFQNADITHSGIWHTIRVTMHGDHIECYYDGHKHLSVRDTTFTGPGMIGLWTKADARTQFDDLTLDGQ